MPNIAMAITNNCSETHLSTARELLQDSPQALTEFEALSNQVENSFKSLIPLIQQFIQKYPTVTHSDTGNIQDLWSHHFTDQEKGMFVLLWAASTYTCCI